MIDYVSARLPVRWRETVRQFAKFAMVGGIGFVVDAEFLYLGIRVLGLSHDAAGLFSFPFAVSVTWIGNRLFTFRDAVPMPAAKQLAKFAAVCAVGLVFNRGTYILLNHTVPLVYDWPVLGLVAGTGVGMFFNFYMARKHVFGL